MNGKEYYLDYLKTTEKFPQSVYHKAKHREVLEVVTSLKQGSLILDACCGIGNITGRYCDDYRVFGIDEQLSAIEHCRKFYKGTYVQANLYNIPLEEDMFDLVLFLDAIEHLTEPVAALKELARVLRPEGKILICTMNYASPLWFILQHTWHRFFAGPCKPYSKDVHPTQYTEMLLRRHCEGLFEELFLRKAVMGMELFYLGEKPAPDDKGHNLINMACGHPNHRIAHIFNEIPLRKCDDCGLIFSDKIREDLDSKALYEGYYKNEIAGRFGFGIERIIRLFRFFRAFKIFTIYPAAKRILDIGSGRGFMLYYLKKYYRYSRTAGTQISKNAFEFSRDRLGLEIYDKDLLELSFDNGSFDIITIWHVLEHVPHPERYIEKIHRILDTSGKLIIEVPNFNSWTRALTKGYWLGLDLGYHMYFFTPGPLRDLLEKYNFKVGSMHTFSLEYSVFISTQSLVSALTGTRHDVFEYLQHGNFSARLIPGIFLFIMLAPVCLLVNLLLYFSGKGEILLVSAEKKDTIMKL